MPYVGNLADLPGGAGTLTSDNNSARSRYFDLIVAEGIVSDKGVWEREPGATPYINQILSDAPLQFTFPARTNGAATIATSFRLNGEFLSAGSLGTKDITGASASLAVSDNVLSGSTIFISWASPTVSDAVVSITDTAGNVYTQLGDNDEFETWVSINVLPLNAGDLITVTRSIAAGTAGFVAEAFQGISAVDETIIESIPGAATSITQTPDFTLIDESEAVVVAYKDFDGAASVTSLNELTPSGLYSGTIATRVWFGLLPFQLAAANALVDYWTSNTVQRLLALGSDGRLYKSSGGAFSPLTMATTMTNVPGASMIVVGGQETAGAPRKAFAFDNGGSRIQTLTGDGVATTDFGNGWDTVNNIPVDWLVNAPRGGIIHKERLWCWAPANAPHNIYASKIRDHENFKNAVGGTFEYVQEIGTGTGNRLAACASFKGMLFAFKYPRGIWYLDDTDVDYLNWRWNLVTDAIGVADSPFSVIPLDDDVMFVGPDGHVHFLSAVTQQGVTTSDMTAAFNLQQWTRENINLNLLHQMTSVWYPARKLAMLGFASPASTVNDLRIYLDFSNATEEGQTVRISYTYRDENRVLAIRRDEPDGVQRPIMADSDGLIWKMDRPDKIKTGRFGVGQARFQYSPTDFSHIDPALANRRKNFDALTVNFNPVGNWNLAVDSVIDGAYHETIYFSMGGGASILGTFVFGDRLGGGTITTNRRRMTGNGYWLSLAGWVQGEGHDFSVAKLIVNFRPSGEEQR